jgi:hypothetical protein
MVLNGLIVNNLKQAEIIGFRFSLAYFGAFEVT